MNDGSTLSESVDHEQAPSQPDSNEESPAVSDSIREETTETTDEEPRTIVVENPDPISSKEVIEVVEQESTEE
jgi:hypothetical protein